MNWPASPTTALCNPRLQSVVSHLAAAEQPLAGRVHLVGICGSGMRSLAMVLAGRGWRVSGSDQSLEQAEEQADELRASGIDVLPGHAAGHLPAGVDLVVFSDAVAADQGGRRRAAELGLPQCSYAEMLGRLTSGTCALAVAGTHGKSTTVAMAAEILLAAGLDPTVVCGAVPLGRSRGGRAGRGEAMLVEACEYRANFLKLRPEVAVVTGVEADHFDCYPALADVEDAFARFAGNVPPHGLLIAAGDCPSAMRATARTACRRQTFGLGAQFDWRAAGLTARRGCYRFRLERRQRIVAEVSLAVPGRHNALNALAAAALAHEAGASAAAISSGLGRFRGLRRRLETVGTLAGVTFVDDYAHHPTEVAASLAAVREMYPGRRLWCVFQPHQTSRTTRLLDELAASLHNADMVAVAEVFPAREPPPSPGDATAADLAAAVRRLGGRALDVHLLTAIGETLPGQLAAGDVVVLMGAGDIGKLRHELPCWIGKIRTAG